jgi:hypothetical protein
MLSLEEWLAIAVLAFFIDAVFHFMYTRFFK